MVIAKKMICSARITRIINPEVDEGSVLEIAEAIMYSASTYSPSSRPLINSWAEISGFFSRLPMAR